MWTLIGIGLLLLGSAVILWGINRGNVPARLAGSAMVVAGFGVMILWG